jgi:hypothetical protein
VSIELIETLRYTLNDAELADAIAVLHEERKKRQQDKLAEMKCTLIKGDTVEFYHSTRGKYLRGTVKKVKTKKALVVEENTTMTWDVPMGMLNKIEVPVSEYQI